MTNRPIHVEQSNNINNSYHVSPTQFCCPKVPKLKELVVDLTEKCNLVVAKYNQVVAEYAALKACLTEYEHCLNTTSRNSSKPPSSDGLTKPNVPDKKKPKSKRPSGGQPGHDGATLNRSDRVDHIEDHPPPCVRGVWAR